MYLFGQGTRVLLHLKVFNSVFYMLEHPVFVPYIHRRVDPLSPMYVWRVCQSFFLLASRTGRVLRVASLLFFTSTGTKCKHRTRAGLTRVSWWHQCRAATQGWGWGLEECWTELHRKQDSKRSPKSTSTIKILSCRYVPWARLGTFSSSSPINHFQIKMCISRFGKSKNKHKMWPCYFISSLFILPLFSSSSHCQAHSEYSISVDWTNRILV